MYADLDSRTTISPGPSTSALSNIVLASLVSCYGAASFLAAEPSTWTGFVGVNILAAIAVVSLWWRGDVNTRTIVGLAILFRLFYVWLPPVLSDDAYRYIWDGLVQIKGINPFAYTPDDPRLSFLKDEPIYGELNSASYYSVYPPLSQFVFRVGAWFYDADWQTSYYVIKGLLAASEIGALLLLARKISARALMLYAWNPLVILAAAGQVHTESLAALCLVAAWVLVLSRRGGWASVMIAGATLVKLYPLVLFPLLWRRFGWRSVWPGAMVVVIAAVPFFHPTAAAHVLSSLELYIRSFEFNAGIYYGVKEIFEMVTGQDWSKQIGPAFRWLFLLSLPVLYVADWRLGWTFRRASVVILGLFFVFSTTIHPWYLVPLLALAVPSTLPSWHWHWLGLASIGTYLLYAGGPYWVWVIVGWVGWGVLGLIRYADPILSALMKYRARRKADLIAEFVPSVEAPTILDLGAGEGYVGLEVGSRLGGTVTLADIRDMNRTDLPLITYDGKKLPVGDSTFDAVLLIYVLHHSDEADGVVLEARRVCRGRIIVLESIYVNAFQRGILSALDRIANHARSFGKMNAKREVLNYGTFEFWQERFAAAGLRVEVARDLGGFIHRRALYVLAP